MNTRYNSTHVNLLLLLTFVSTPLILGVNFDQCLKDVNDGKFGEIGGTDNRGGRMPVSTATGITYELCIRACGSGSEPFQWSVFSQQFSSWLLPWLALVSQLPFGSNDKFENLLSILLTVGSPTLAAYSLALTVLNDRWIARRFSSYTYPNTRQAVRILSSLQQSPLEINTQNSLLSSLIVLPHNDEWWNELVTWLDYTHSWSISAVASTAWVIIAYVFTVIDSLLTGVITTSVNANGQSVGSLWIWLLAIVIGWLQISPKCDATRISQAMRRANNIAYVADSRGAPVLAASLSQEQAISFKQGVEDPLYSDEFCTVPIYNYARFLRWVQAVENVSEMFRAASQRAKLHQSVDSDVDWIKEERYVICVDPRNRIGTRAQVEAYCLPLGETSTFSKYESGWAPNVFSRIILASSIALFLQWGTTGAAIVVAWFSPTIGLGCRSASYILYGIVSTVVWMLLLISSFLSHCVSTSSHRDRTIAVSLARWASINMRRLGKVLAILNTFWVLVSCLFQMSNFFDRCYCNGSVLGRGVKTWIILSIVQDDVLGIRGAWIGGVVLAAGSATLFVIFVNLFVNPPLPD